MEKSWNGVFEFLWEPCICFFLFITPIVELSKSEKPCVHLTSNNVVMALKDLYFSLKVVPLLIALRTYFISILGRSKACPNEGITSCLICVHKEALERRCCFKRGSKGCTLFSYSTWYICIFKIYRGSNMSAHECIIEFIKQVVEKGLNARLGEIFYYVIAWTCTDHMRTVC